MPPSPEVTKGANKRRNTMKSQLVYTAIAVMGMVGYSNAAQEVPSPQRALSPYSSFCGFAFGENIDTFASDAKREDSSESASVSVKLPELVSSFTLQRPFRNFTKGTVHAEPIGRKVYKVVFDTFYFPDQTKGAGMTEHQTTLAALKQRFGEANCKSKQTSLGDFEHVFTVGNMKITFEYTTAGVFDKESLDLRAENATIWDNYENQAETIVQNACKKAAAEALNKFIEEGRVESSSQDKEGPMVEGADVL